MSKHTPRRVTIFLGSAFCAAVAAIMVPAHPAVACGEVEGSGSCAGATAAADEARWMLRRVVTAIKADEPRALQAFSHGTDGFRTVDTYVFCVSSANGRLTAHPDPDLIGRNTHVLRDRNGNLSTAEMLDVARENQVAEVSYTHPRLVSRRPAPKTAFVTRVKDQVCGIGHYDENTKRQGRQISVGS